MIKRLFLAAALAAFSFPAMAQSLAESTILKPISAAYRLGFSSTSRALTSSLSANAEVARLVCTQPCLVQTAVSGQTPVALVGGTTGSIYLPANWAEYIQVPRNGKVAAIALSTDGVLYIQEFGR